MLVIIELRVTSTKDIQGEIAGLPIARNSIAWATMIYLNFAWQTGDFPHFYAALIGRLRNGENNLVLLVPFVAERLDAGVMSDIRFSLEAQCAALDRTVTLITIGPLKRESAAGVEWGKIIGQPIRGAFEATQDASAFVKAMEPGDALTPAWSNLSRGVDSAHYIAYTEACRGFTDEFFQRFDPRDFVGTSRFVCIWDRTVPVEGGANPQYNSTQAGNEQLARRLLEALPLNAVLLVGTDFNDATRRLPKVFDLGKFWTRLGTIRGRVQENGFFDYMTALYNCDVVHLGMKSGGLDSLGLWGQKVVFVDSEAAPAITKERVAFFDTPRFSSVEVSSMPSPIGKTIDEIRLADRREDVERQRRGEKLKGDSIRTTVPAKMVADVVIQARAKDDLFTKEDLDRIIAKVRTAFGS